MGTVIELYRNNDQVVTDAFDRIVVEVFMEKEKNQHSTFLLCGCDAHVGTTSISVELAISLAVSGWKTVLVDADLRKDERYKRLNQKTEAGISDYVTGKTEGKSVIYHTNWEGLDYIACGKNDSETPVKILCSQRMGQLVERLKEEYDFAIFDMPSLNSAVDAKILGARLDCTYLIAAAEQTTFKNLSGACEQMKEAGANVAGVIFNKVSVDEYARIIENYSYFSQKEYLDDNKFYHEEQKQKKKSLIRSFFGKLLGVFLLVLLTASAGMTGNVRTVQAESQVSADVQNEQMPTIIVSDYHIQEGACAPGSSFTINITVKNVSPYTGAYQMVLSLYPQTEGVAFQTGETNQRYLEYLEQGAEAEIQYEMKISEDVKSDAAVLELVSAYTNANGTGGNNSSMISPEISKMSELEIISVKASENAVEGAQSLFNIRYENSGDGDVAAASVRLEGNIEDSGKEIQLDIPESGRQNYKDIHVVFTKDGNQKLDISVTYTDRNGNTFELKPQPVYVRVMPQTKAGETEVKISGENSFAAQTTVFVTAGVAAIALFLILLFILHGRKRYSERKDPDNRDRKNQEKPMR